MLDTATGNDVLSNEQLRAKVGVRQEGFVSRALFAERKGLSEDLVRGWCDRHWTRGHHYCVIGKTTGNYILKSLDKYKGVNYYIDTR